MPLQINLRFCLPLLQDPNRPTNRRRLSDQQGSRNAGDGTPVNPVDASWVAAKAEPNVTFIGIVSEISRGEF